MSKKPPDLSEDSSEDLVECMSWDDDPATANASMSELWFRYKKYIYVALSRYCGHRFSAEDVLDFTSDTFLRAKVRAGSFVNEGIEDPKQATKKVGAWLMSVARSVVADHDRERITRPVSIPLEDETDRPIVTVRSSPEHLELVGLMRRAVHDASILSVKELDVVLTTMEYYRPGDVHQRLPSGVAAALAARHDIQPESITQLRNRAYKKIRLYIDAEMAAMNETAS